MEEERRLCYVAITRARQTLTVSYARQRMLYGRTSSNPPSRFLEELPEDPILWQGKEQAPARGSWDSGSSWSGSAFGRTDSTAPGKERPAAVRPQRPRRVWNSGYTAPAAHTAPLLQLQGGDAVRHRTYGEGMVLSVRPMGNDALVEIAFNGVGTKRLMLRSAGEHLTKL